MKEIEALKSQNHEKETFIEKNKKAMLDQFSHLSDPQKDKILMMDGQIQNKKNQLEQERAKAEESES